MSFPCFIGTAAFDRNIPGHALLQQKLHRLNRFFAQEAAHLPAEGGILGREGEVHQ